MKTKSIDLDRSLTTSLAMCCIMRAPGMNAMTAYDIASEIAAYGLVKVVRCAECIHHINGCCILMDRETDPEDYCRKGMS